MLNEVDHLNNEDEVGSEFDDCCFDEHYLVGILENQQKWNGASTKNHPKKFRCVKKDMCSRLQNYMV